MTEIATQIFADRGVGTKDATSSVGGGDFLERILGLIRATGFTVAIFSKKTRSTALANIHLELGFAAMCGKPLIILKGKGAKSPSDLTRKDWIEYDPAKEDAFRDSINKAVDMIDETGPFETLLLDTALGAKSMDCAVALERAMRAFLLTSDPAILNKAEAIGERLIECDEGEAIADLERLRSELKLFLALGQSALRLAA